MAVDGVALGSAVSAWVSACVGECARGPAQASAFEVAEAIRSLEKGLSGFFHLSNGLTLLPLGVAVVAGRAYSRWLGWVGMVAGLAFLLGGVVTTRTASSPEAGVFLTPGLALLVVFLLGVGVAMWRRAPSARSPAVVLAAEWAAAGSPGL